MPRTVLLLLPCVLAVGGCPRASTGDAGPGSSGGMMLGRWIAAEGCTIPEIDAEPERFTQHMRGGAGYAGSTVKIHPQYDYSSKGYVYVKDLDSGVRLSYTSSDSDHIASDVDPACKYERAH